MPVTLTLATAEVEAIAAHIQEHAEHAELDRCFADAATYWLRAGMLLAQAATQREHLTDEADYCLAQAARCAAVPTLTWQERHERAGGPDGIEAVGIVA